MAQNYLNMSREGEKVPQRLDQSLHTIYQEDVEHTEAEQSRLMRRSNDVSKKRFLRPKKSQNIKSLVKKPSDNAFFLPSVEDGPGQ